MKKMYAFCFETNINKWCLWLKWVPLHDIFFSFNDAAPTGVEDGTQVLAHAKQAFPPWATSPAHFYFILKQIFTCLPRLPWASLNLLVSFLPWPPI